MAAGSPPPTAPHGAAGRPHGRSHPCSSCSGCPPRAFRRQDVFASWRPRRSSTRALGATTAAERLSARPRSSAGRVRLGRPPHTAGRGVRRPGRGRRQGGRPPRSGWPSEPTTAERAPAPSPSSSRVIDDLGRSSSSPSPGASTPPGPTAGCTGRWAPPPADRVAQAEHKAAERAERALDRLGALDGVEPSTTLEVFARTLEQSRVRPRAGGALRRRRPRRLGGDGHRPRPRPRGGARASPRAPSRAPCATTPSSPHRPERVATGGESRPPGPIASSGSTGTSSPRSSRRGRQVLCVPEATSVAADRALPSRWVLRHRHPARPGRPGGRRPPGGEAPWSPARRLVRPGLRTAAVPATGREHRLRGPARRRRATLTGTDDARTVRGAATIAARRSDAFTRFDGNLAGMAVPSPIDRVTSPTRLERWAACPHRHLVEDLLGAARWRTPRRRWPSRPSTAATSSTRRSRRSCSACWPGPQGSSRGPAIRGCPADVALLEDIGAALLRQVRGARGHRSTDLLAPATAAGSSNDLSDLAPTPGAGWSPHRPARRRAQLRVRRRRLEAVAVPAPRRPGRSRPAGAPIASTGPTTDRSTSPTTRPAPPTGTTRLEKGDPIQAGTKLQLPRSTAWPATGGRRPSHPGPRRLLVRLPAAASSRRSATRSPTRSSSAPLAGARRDRPQHRGGRFPRPPRRTARRGSASAARVQPRRPRHGRATQAVGAQAVRPRAGPLPAGWPSRSTTRLRRRRRGGRRETSSASDGKPVAPRPGTRDRIATNLGTTLFV